MRRAPRAPTEAFTKRAWAYQARALQGVSRTFALTIPQLPRELRKVVGNAYLLCRIADTIEDEPALEAARKREYLRRLVHVVAGRVPAGPFAAELRPLLSGATTDAERELVEKTASVVHLTHRFRAAQREAIPAVRRHHDGRHGRVRRPGARGARQHTGTRPVLLSRRGRGRRDDHGPRLRPFRRDRVQAGPAVPAVFGLRTRPAARQHPQRCLGRPVAGRLLVAPGGVRGRPGSANVDCARPGVLPKAC